ncbi:MAG: HAD hydrolase-like protein [Planctomycetia bacterium]|nr:HAD hydrolase-like protein [Planctomycetia bacterium]
MSTPYVFLFDIDGTLLSSGGAGKMALETAFLNLFGLMEIRKQVPYSGRTDVAIAHELLQAHDIDPSLENISKLQESYLNQLPQALNCKKGSVLPGVIPLLEALRSSSHSIMIGLLTGNIRRGAQVKLGHYDMNHFFSFGGFGDGVHTRNEVAQAAWNEARQFAGVELSPNRTWVIGDTPLDISCARHIGAKVLAVSTGMHPHDELESHKPDLLAASLNHPVLLSRMLV